MKILAKTTGPTLVCLSGDFLDAYEYRVVEYDTRVRDWNNRKLLDIKSFIKDDGEADAPKTEEVKEVVEEAPKPEIKEEVKEEVKEEQPKSKRKSRR